MLLKFIMQKQPPIRSIAINYRNTGNIRQGSPLATQALTVGYDSLLIDINGTVW